MLDIDEMGSKEIQTSYNQVKDMNHQQHALEGHHTLMPIFRRPGHIHIYKPG